EVNLLLDIPFAYRLAGLFVLGAAAGGFLNWAIYCFAWSPRWISPWSTPPAGQPPRTWGDRLPIVGWIGLRREEVTHGAGFWVRPLLIELGFGVAIAWLYWWEVDQRALVALWEQFGGAILPGPLPADQLPADRYLTLATSAALHAPYLSHVILLALMTVATFIDFDEKTIPDFITVPGVWIGLLLAVTLPWAILPGFVVTTLDGQTYYEILQTRSPLPWPAEWFNRATIGQLTIAVGIYIAWSVALLPRILRLRRGVRRGLALMLARIRREPVSLFIFVQAVIGCAAIALVWWIGGERWLGLFTALVGLAVGGGMIWLVRTIGTFALRREAMGFGDVTLMAMVGAFIGWQPCLMIFFLAPLAGLLLGLLQWLLRRDDEIPYGPFLCLATGFVVVLWPTIWEWAMPIFAQGLLVPVAMLFCLLLMGVMLSIWRVIKRALFTR
ncbi:MAG: prepilin peptidase, partial [Pirellulales bacterium]